MCVCERQGEEFFPIISEILQPEAYNAASVLGHGALWWQMIRGALGLNEQIYFGASNPLSLLTSSIAVIGPVVGVSTRRRPG